MKVLFAGDVVGKPGRQALASLVPKLKNAGVDFTIVNAENAAGGAGITVEIAEQLFSIGVDVITGGDEIFRNREYADKKLCDDPRVLRPANISSRAVGHGYATFDTPLGTIAVMVLIGRVFMDPVNCPFETADRLIEKLGNVYIRIVDMHCEATSEKQAMGRYLDGRVSAVLGTHTHVQTADERILAQGTAYITDTGMTGAHDSIIGFKHEGSLKLFLSGMPSKLEVASEDARLNAVVVDIASDGRAVAIRRLNLPIDAEIEPGFLA